MKQERMDRDWEESHIDEGSSDSEDKEPEKIKEYWAVMEWIKGIKKVRCTCDLVDTY